MVSEVGSALTATSKWNILIPSDPSKNGSRQLHATMLEVSKRMRVACMLTSYYVAKVWLEIFLVTS